MIKYINDTFGIMVVAACIMSNRVIILFLEFLETNIHSGVFLFFSLIIKVIDVYDNSGWLIPLKVWTHTHIRVIESWVYNFLHILN